MAAEQAALLTIEGASKAYRGQSALRSIDLSLGSGELLGLLGPNGAGKTTLIRCIAGRLRLDHGSIRWSDRQGRRQLGVVPQSLAIYEDLTAEQNLEIFGRLHGVGRRQLGTRIAQALQWSNLESRRRHRVASFSGGMKRRLNIACAVLHEPRVLLLDEPTVGVDPQSRERIYTMLGQLRDQGVGILLTTHHLEEAQYRCDRIAIIDQGRIVRVGTLDELISATIGQRQRLTIHFAGDVPLQNVMQIDETEQVGSTWIHDASEELPELLGTLKELGARVDRLTLQSPNLHQVFLQLTGKELRE